ncbi:DUF4148 domain-containing protein [Pandoraea sp. PE-S2T-3]|uniref:DUF4148 domain-containing protein n=1 Tax=Pandoraea sp. PE-S2T-3 TaxID=1986993 RepID=UPI00159559DD|nr:DUF4148 domain-containing protein [Pandoraea sp. PE-S2T-3]
MIKRILIISTLSASALLSMSVQATARYDNSVPPFAADTGPAVARDDVAKQLKDVHANGVPVPSNLKALQGTQSPSKMTREQVQKELEAAAEQGLLNQPDSVYPKLPLVE